MSSNRNRLQVIQGTDDCTYSAPITFGSHPVQKPPCDVPSRCDDDARLLTHQTVSPEPSIVYAISTAVGTDKSKGCGTFICCGGVSA